MDKQHFAQLVKGVREMKRHMAGKPVRGAKTTELAAPDVRTIREAAKISQSQFAKLIGVNLLHVAKLGAAPHAVHRPCQGAAQNRRVEPEGH